MTKYESVAERIAQIAREASGVPVVHAPSSSAGEKIIYRCTNGKCDGDYESFKVTMRHVSRDVSEAFLREKLVTAALCRPGSESPLMTDACPVFTVRSEGGGSGYIQRTGHFFVISVYEVRRRMTDDERSGDNE